MSYLGTKPQTATQLASGIVTTESIADGAVGTADIAASAVTPAKLSTGAPTWNSSSQLLVGTNTVPSGGIMSACFYGATAGGVQVAYGSSGGGAVTPASGAGLRFYTYTGAVGSESYTTAMTIDSSGRVTMPYQPAFHAKRNAAFNSGSGVIVFEDVTVNISSSYNSSNGKFTAPVAGTYIFLVSFFTNIANAPIDFRILKNGSDIGGNATTGTTTVARDCHAYAITTLAASDYIEVIAAGYGTNIPSGLGIFQTFSGHLIG